MMIYRSEEVNERERKRELVIYKSEEERESERD